MLKRLRDLREDHDLSQKDVATTLHCSQQAYSYYENGSRDLPISMLRKLCLFYGVSADYILGLSDDPTPSKRKNQ